MNIIKIVIECNFCNYFCNCFVMALCEHGYIIGSGIRSKKRVKNFARFFRCHASRETVYKPLFRFFLGGAAQGISCFAFPFFKCGKVPIEMLETVRTNFFVHVVQGFDFATANLAGKGIIIINLRNDFTGIFVHVGDYRFHFFTVQVWHRWHSLG